MTAGERTAFLVFSVTLLIADTARDQTGGTAPCPRSGRAVHFVVRKILWWSSMNQGSPWGPTATFVTW
jgi:hypothetical protein